ncbi:MAG: hypothetical protein GC168_08635 [Candidatus Hydrogenedens sp.]|nr:hypothetical protein [Candidatus Hydrogenedens sp.]
MVTLGISEDQFDSGAALSDGTRLLFASNEERYTRRKNEGGFPHRSLQALLEYTGIDAGDIERIVIPGFNTPPLPVRMFPGIHRTNFDARRRDPESPTARFMDFVRYHTPITHAREHDWVSLACRPMLRPVTRRKLPGVLRNRPLEFLEHHHVHAAGAWVLSGIDEALCVTADGMGDGLSSTVSRCTPGGGVERIAAMRWSDSFGLMFEMLTEAMGFVSHRDEGKLTGLAASGDPRAVKLPSMFHVQEGQLCYHGQYGASGIRWARRELVEKYRREDIAAWAQEQLESNMLALVEYWLARTGLRSLVLAGGIFGNVKLNQRLHELDAVERLFVVPNMGDGGLSASACCAAGAVARAPITDVFLGEGYDTAACEAALKAAKLDYIRCDDPESTAAQMLAEGNMVARFRGRMEWGPRALGARSILAPASDPVIVERLNQALARSDFMPFAPALLDEDADDYLEGLTAARHAAEFMTVCFRCKQRMRDEFPAVVHVDGTARAQLVRADRNPGLHRVLSEYKARTGQTAVLNTSFNIHEEPIVRTPEHAVRAFQTARLDCLLLEDFLVKRPA